jgi:hypothetical protein
MKETVMKTSTLHVPVGLPAATVIDALPYASHAAGYLQCPGDTYGDAVIDNPDSDPSHVACKYLSADQLGGKP